MTKTATATVAANQTMDGRMYFDGALVSVSVVGGSYGFIIPGSFPCCRCCHRIGKPTSDRSKLGIRIAFVRLFVQVLFGRVRNCRIFGSPLAQFPLQRAAMNSEPPRRFADVAAAIGKDTMNVFPFVSCQRRGGKADGAVGNGWLVAPHESRKNIIGIGRLAEKVDSAGTDRVDRSGDAAET